MTSPFSNFRGTPDVFTKFGYSCYLIYSIKTSFVGIENLTALKCVLKFGVSEDTSQRRASSTRQVDL
jgi:hypothetical protein